MMTAPIPENEAYRLRTMQLYRILDTASEKALDDLTNLAATICRTPVSLISLVDKDRQWFKSRVGLKATETPRDIAFCSHAIMGDDLFVVKDAAKDERFSDNPLVKDYPAIRFYAGAPLIVENGVALGTLCVIDRKPRVLTKHQRNAIQILARAVVTQLELRRSHDVVRAAEHFLPICVNCNNIRAEDETWHSLHEYVTESVHVSHGLCPTCKVDFFAN